VISRITKVEVGVISRSGKLRLITITVPLEPEGFFRSVAAIVSGEAENKTSWHPGYPYQDFNYTGYHRLCYNTVNEKKMIIIFLLLRRATQRGRT